MRYDVWYMYMYGCNGWLKTASLAIWSASQDHLPTILPWVLKTTRAVLHVQKRGLIW